MIASAQTLRGLRPVEPFEDRKVFEGMSYGLSSAGYDIRIAEDTHLAPGEFSLASSIERFWMPFSLLGIVHDKSTWARKGIAVQNTVIEPGWRGYLTLELTNHSDKYVFIKSGSPIAQVVFHLLDHPTEQPYQGKYQDQQAGPQHARSE
jgi:dCTP deaminase